MTTLADQDTPILHGPDLVVRQDKTEERCLDIHRHHPGNPLAAAHIRQVGRILQVEGQKAGRILGCSLHRTERPGDRPGAVLSSAVSQDESMDPRSSFRVQKSAVSAIEGLMRVISSLEIEQEETQAQTVDAEIHDVFEQLPPADPVTKDNIQDQIGLVKNFFLAKLHANGDQPLVEDEDLPVKQKRPRPRLGATGKIVSPQKRPPKEQIALAKKKKKLEAGKAQVTDPKPGGPNSTPEKGKKLGKNIPALPNGAPNSIQAPSMERVDSLQSQGVASSPPGDIKDEAVGMLSPESNEQ